MSDQRVLDEIPSWSKAAAERFFTDGKLNRSAQHVDIVTEFREGGAGIGVWLEDTKLEVKDGIWIVP